MKYHAQILVASFTLINPTLHAAPGSVDASFDAGSGVNGSVQTLALRPNGKVVIGGNFSTVRNLVRSRIAQLNADGTGDTNFNPGTGANAIVRCVSVQPDGKVIIGGEFGQVNNISLSRIARLNTDGSVDTTFRPGSFGGVTPFGVTAMAVQSDGKVVIGGDFTSVNGTNRNYIARLNADGTLDLSFNPGAGANSGIRALLIQPDGKVVIGGSFSMINGTNRNYIARLNANGSLDLTFTLHANAQVYAIGRRMDGDMIIAGNFLRLTNNNVTFSHSRVARLDENGNVNSALSSVINAAVRSLAVLPDNKVVVAGEFTDVNGISRNRVARLHTDGSIDFGFDLGSGANNTVWSVARQPDDKLMVGGDFTDVNSLPACYVGRLLTNAAVDHGFTPCTGANQSVRSIALQCGDVFIAGAFTGFDGTNRNRLARLDGSGTLVANFNPGTAADAIIHSLALQPDGELLIGGEFVNFNTRPRSRIARVNVEGRLDTNFSAGATGAVYNVAVQTNGSVIIGGSFNLVNGVVRTRLARLNPDGTLDNGFSPSANNSVRAIAVQTDGAIVVAGDFTSITGSNRARIARLNPSGTLDATFNPGNGANGTVHAVALQPDGKVLIGGAFTTVSGGSRNRIARLNPDGSLDVTFTPGTGLNDTNYCVALQWNDKILIGGDFTTVNGTARLRVARLNTNGTLDATFNPGEGANRTVRCVAVQSDGNAIFGGDFDLFGGFARGYMVRLFGDPSPETSITIERSGQNVRISWSTNSLAGFRLQHTRDLACPPIWVDLTPLPVVNGTNFVVMTTASEDRQFYQLKR